MLLLLLDHWKGRPQGQQRRIEYVVDTHPHTCTGRTCLTSISVPTRGRFPLPHLATKREDRHLPSSDPTSTLERLSQSSASRRLASAPNCNLREERFRRYG